MSFHETTPPQSIHSSDLSLPASTPPQQFILPNPMPLPHSATHDIPPHMTSLPHAASHNTSPRIIPSSTPSHGRSSPDLQAQVIRSFRYTPDMMPMLGERGAPPLFKGSHEKVKSFLKKFNTLCARYSVTSNEEKCEQILEYCNDKVTQLIEALPGFRNSDWSALEEEMKQHFDADRKETRNTICRLAKFTSRQSAKKIRSLTHWKKYERKFITISGWLRKANKITEDLEATYFWLGIHPDTRQKIENRLYARHPHISVKTAFPMKQVSEIALEVFERDRFEFNLVSAGYESDSDSSDDESDSSDDKSEDDQERLKARLKALKSPRAHKSRTGRAKAADPADPIIEDVQVISPLYSSKVPGRYRKTPPGESEVEDLIKKMSQMNIKDPDYAVTYYRAFCLDERIARIFPEPAKQAMQPATREFPRTSSSTLPRANIAAPVAQNSAPSSAPSFPTRPPLTCYGCGAQGHGLRNCPPMIDLASKGIIARDSEGHYFWPNGQRIQRNPGEDYVPAIHRMCAQATPAVSNFITSYEVEDYLTEDEEEEEDADEFLADLDPLDVLAAERAPKTVTMTRKDVLGKPSAIRTRPAVNEDTGRRTRSKGSAPDPKPAGLPSRVKPSVPEIPSIVNPIPADVRPRHEFTAEDIAMADEEPQGPQKASTAESKSSDRAVKATRAFARQAEILDLMEQEALFR